MRVEQVTELGEDSPKLEIPWTARGPDRAYFDLRDDPRSIARIEAARQHAPLRALLVAVNGEDSAFATVRCRVTRNAEAPADSNRRQFRSEIDLVFAEARANAEQSRFEELMKRLAELFGREGGADYLWVRLSLRHCLFAGAPGKGFCLAIGLSADGASAEQAEVRWGLALARVQQALLFLSRGLRQQGFTSQ